MGWDFIRGASRSDVIAERIRDWKSDDYSKETIGKCLMHQLVLDEDVHVLWTAWEISENGVARRFIGCDLLEEKTGFGWGYKGMSEAEGPCYYSCPLAFLEEVPEANAEWRRRVREHHANSARVLYDQEHRWKER